MKKIVLTRRQVVKTLLALGVGSSYIAYTKFLAADNSVMAVGEPLKNADKATLEIFTALSSIITLHDDLDPGMAQRMYKVFMDEPWGPDHILRLYKKIAAALPQYADKKKRPPMKDKSWQLDDGEKWFAGHLLTTWYTGVYYHEQRPHQVISYENALMFEATRGLIPVPYMEATGFGMWENPPDKAE